MRSVGILITILALYAQNASATLWYFLRYYPPSGQKFTSFTGTMVIPTLKEAGTFYLWPGLQPTDNSGVYQNVLDGRSGTWWIGSGWCCSNPSLPWGGGFNTYGGETVKFSNVLGSDVWTSTLTRVSAGTVVTNDFALAGKTFNQALFAIELDGVTWDFGQLAFTDVEIEATGTSTSWCTNAPENYNSATSYSLSGVVLCGPTGTSCTSTSTTPPPTTGGSSGSVPKFGQCGGSGWTGGTTCVDSTCTYSNECVENKSYCLLGIFDVSMPLVYGEGGDRASKRLQEEIHKSYKGTDFEQFTVGLNLSTIPEAARFVAS